MDSMRRLLRDYGAAVLIAVVIALMIRFFVVEAYRIPSQAMRPTLEAGDTIFVAKWPFGFRIPWTQTRINQGRLPKRGEVVVYSFPEDPRRDYIKRVIGLPGDTVELKNGKIILNGKSLSKTESVCGDEEVPGEVGENAGSLRWSVCREPPLLEIPQPVKVGNGQVLVVGDSRTLNLESRRAKNWGLVPVEAIKGKALCIWLSIELPGMGPHGSWFSRIRFERMFENIK